MYTGGQVSQRTYWAVHKWMMYWFGRPTVCENCKQEKKHIDWANLSGEYRYDRDDFKALCRSCHRIFDKGNFCKNGHELTHENTYHNATSSKYNARICRTCARARVAKYDKKIRMEAGSVY